MFSSLSSVFATLTFTLSVAWSIPFLLSRYFGYQLYQIKENDKIKIFQKKIKYSSIQIEEFKPFGVFYGQYYVGFFAEKERNQNVMYIVCTKEQFTELSTNNVSTDTTIQKHKIKLMERSNGTYDWIYYRNRTLEFFPDRFKSRVNQENFINTVKKYYENNNFNCVAYLEGCPGSGKSTVGILLAKALGGRLCNTFNPTDPGDSLSGLYNNADIGSDNPLIIFIDEIDIIINKIHKNEILKHKNIQTYVHDKITWNSFLDSIDIGLYPNLIIIFTSNISHKELSEKTDKSYLRGGRINIVCNLELDTNSIISV